MTSTCVIVADGILRHPISGQPTTVGRRLYTGLATTYRLAVLSDTHATLATWLRVEGFTPPAEYVVTSQATDPDDPAARRLDQLRRLAAYGCAVELVIEPNPAVAAVLLGHGYTVMLLAHPAYAQPSWRPDYTGSSRRWDDLVAEIDRQRTLRSADTRLNPED